MTYTTNVYNFQQWMSRLPQRWWTQRNAIRNANCKTSWIIKILNAHCAFRKCLKAYLSECLYTPLIPSCMVMDYGFDNDSYEELSLLECIWRFKHCLVYETLPALVKCTSCMLILEIVWQWIVHIRIVIESQANILIDVRDKVHD